MERAHLIHCIEILRKAGIQLERGLRPLEVKAVETKYGFKFPPDLQLLLEIALPVSPPFPDWRAGLFSESASGQIWDRMLWPIEGFLFDVVENGYWHGAWGERPEGMKERELVLKQCFMDAPRLVPVYAHRYMPDAPHEMGNPVYSVYQADMIVYGVDLVSYFAREFDAPLPEGYSPAMFPRGVRFWEGMV